MDLLFTSAAAYLTVLAGMDLQVQDPGRPSKGIAQLVKDIVAEDGIGGFFKGWWAQIVALGSSNFVYFYASCMIKVIIITRYIEMPSRCTRLTGVDADKIFCLHAGKVGARWDQ